MNNGGVMSVAAMVLAIVGLILCWFPFVGWLGVAFALVAVILGIISMKSAKGNKGLGIVGLVIGAIALFGGAIVQTVYIVAVDKGLDAYQEATAEDSKDLPPEAPFSPRQ
jgi:hypothetical protein